MKERERERERERKREREKERGVRKAGGRARKSGSSMKNRANEFSSLSGNRFSSANNLRDCWEAKEISGLYRGEGGKNGTIIGARRPVSTNGAKSVAGRRIPNRVVDSGKGKQGGEAWCKKRGFLMACCSH